MTELPSSQPKASSAEWAIVALVAAALGWTTYGLGGYVAETMTVTCVLVMAAFAVAHLAAASGRVQRASWWVLPFLIYGAANVIWVTPMRWRGWLDWATWAHMAAIFWVTLNGVRTRRPRTALLASVGVIALGAVALGCYQRFLAPEWLPLGRSQTEQFFGRASAPFGSPNSLAGLMVLLTPPSAALALRRGASAYERVVFGWLTLLLATTLALTISRGGWMALTLALVAWPVWRAGGRWRARSVGLALILLVGMAGTAWAVMRASPLAQRRVVALASDGGERSRPVMWRAAWEIFKVQPWLGSGAGSYSVMFEPHRSETEQKLPQWAHNDYLNTLSDYGVVGLALLGLAVGGVASEARRARARESSAGTRRHRHDVLEFSLVRQGVVVGLMAFGLHAFVDFHLKIPALGMTAAVLAGLLARAPQTNGVIEPARQGWRGRAAVVGVILAGGAVALIAVAVPFYRAEALRFLERERLEKLGRTEREPRVILEAAERARDVFSRALMLDPRNGDAWADRAYSLTIIGHYRPEEQGALGKAAEADARAALALSSAVPEFWARLGVALDMQGRWNEAGDAFVEALNRAPLSGSLWFYQAYHLSLNRVTFPLARAAVATCLRLDPGNHQAEALRRRLSAAK